MSLAQSPVTHAEAAHMQRDELEFLPHTVSQEFIQDGSKLNIRATSLKAIENLEGTRRKHTFSEL